MNTRLKFIAGGVLIFGTAGYLVASWISETGMFWLTPTALHAKVAADSSFAGVKVKVTGWVVPGSIIRQPNGRDLSFVATDGEREFKVTYDRVPPDTFTDSAAVVVTGTLRPDGTFAATELLAKCASRFEAVPDSMDYKYQSAPGYKSMVKEKT